MGKNRTKILAPSMLSADFSRLDEEIIDLKKNGIKWLHMDVADGNFVPAITYGHKFISDLRHHDDLIFDTHMMVSAPEKHIHDYVKAGSDIITVHSEATVHLHSTIVAIKNEKVKSGVAIIPTTPVSSIELILEMVDQVLIMNVDPGFGGQKLIPFSYKKIRELAKLRDKYDLNFNIVVDGGVNEHNAVSLMEAGANVLIMGTGYFFATDRKALISLVQG
jgi:ribulose-phosphate 3-epimerase